VTAIGVLADAPLPGRCAQRLLAAHGAAWASALSAAMLRDTLDGLMAVDADHRLVVASPVVAAPGEEDDVDARARAAASVLERHVFAPWEIAVAPEDGDGARLAHAFRLLLERASIAAVVSSRAPSAPTEPLAAALAASVPGDARIVLGPTENGGFYAIVRGGGRSDRATADLPWGTPAVAATIRARCKDLDLPVSELPRWYAVEEPSDVLRLLEEMRRHPERAPRTAQFLVTHG
jgi:hypothetical protein